MNLDRIRAHLPADVASRLAALHARWVRTVDADARDPSGFVAWLASEGEIDAEQLRTLLADASEGFTLDDAVAPAAAPGPAGAPVRKAFGLLGRGAMGEVHVARDIHLSRNVAVKRLAEKYRQDARIRERFATEVQITAQLEHPGIIPIYAYEPDDGGVPSYAMKLVRGRTLDRWLEDARAAARAGQPVPAGRDLATRLDLFRSICAAVHYAHTRGVIHRDLKPDNVMIGAFEEVVVMDWGVARKIGGPEESLNTLARAEPDAVHTMLGVAVGTPTYMSPEQAQGRNDELDARSDQYALGLILHELVTLRRAITGDNVAAKLYRASRGERDPLVPLDARERVPAGLAAIIAKATSLAPTDRYPDVAALADDVRRFQRDEEVHAHPDTPVERMQRWVAHHRELTLAGVFGLTTLFALVMLAALVGGVAAVEAKRAEAARHEAQLAELIAQVNRQAHRIDTALLGYEALVGEVAAAAEHAMTQPPPDVRWYRSESWGTPEGPPDAARRAKYPSIVSFAHPDVKLAPGVDPVAVDAQVRRLVGLRPTYTDVMLRSDGPDLAGLPAADVPGRLGDQGVPMAWTYLATEDGVLVGYPGTGEYPAGYDPRAQPWYREDTGRGARWIPASIDESGFGMLLTVTRGVYVADKRVGIAAVDIGLRRLIDELLVPPELAGRVQVWLVDEQRPPRTLASTDGGADPPPFDDPIVLAGLAAGRTAGQAAVDDETLVWAPLPALGWTYVVRGRQLLDSPAEPAP